MDKFPVNQGHVAGLITKATFNEEAKRVNLAVLTTNGDKQQFMNVLISGEERYNNFKKDFEIAKVNLGTRQNDKNETKQNFPLIKITGEAFFSVNTHNEIKNKNYTLIASGNLEERTDKYFLTTTPEQVTEFRKTHNSFSVDNNVLQIRGTIASEPKIIKGKNYIYCYDKYD